MVTYSHYSSTKKILKRVIIEHSIRLKKKTFQDSPFLQKLLIVLNFILYYAKASSAINFLRNKKKPKKVFLDTQKFLTNPT